MPIVADAAVAVRGDLTRFNNDLNSGLNKASTRAKGFGSILDKALSPAALVGGLAGGFAVTQVAAFLGDAVAAASDLGETVSKTSQIFGDEALPALEEWAEGAAQAMGQSKQQALDGASTFAIFGKSAGLAGQELVGFSTDLSGLASDMSSFFNTSPEEAIEAIGAALRGESEPIRKYGVLLNDATLKQRALAMGLIETTTQALTPQNRVLAAQAEIFAQTADAQGDFARTSGGLANQQRILNAELQNMTAEIGAALLPLMVEFIGFVLEVVDATREWAHENEELLGGIGTAFGIFGEAIFGTLDEIITRIGGTIDATVALGQAVALLQAQKWQEAGERIGEAMEAIDRVGRGRAARDEQRVSERALEASGDAWDSYQTAVSTAAGAAVDSVEATGPDMHDAIADPVGTGAEDATTALAGFTEHVKDEFAALEGVENITTIGEAAAQQIAVDLIGGRQVIYNSAYEMMLGLPDAVLAARIAAVDHAAQAPGDIAQAIIDNTDVLQSAAETITQIVTGELDVITSAAELEGLQAQVNYARGFQAGNPALELILDQQQRDIDAQWIAIHLRAQGRGFEGAEGYARGMALGHFLIEAEAEGQLTRQDEIWARTIDIAGERGYDTPEEFALAMAEAQSLVGDAAESVAAEADEVWDKMPAEARREGTATGEGFGAGVGSARAAVEKAGIALAKAATDPLFDGGGKAYGYGAAISAEVARGISENAYQAKAAAEAVGRVIHGAIGIASEPQDPASPLRGITQWGGNMVNTVASGIFGELNTATDAADALATAMNDAARERLQAMGVALTKEVLDNYAESAAKLRRAYDPTTDTLFEDASFAPKDFAGTRSPFGTVFPDYIHTLKEVIAWEQRVIRNTPNAPNVVKAVEDGLLHVADRVGPAVSTIVDPLRAMVRSTASELSAALAPVLDPRQAGVAVPSGDAAGMATSASSNTYQVSLLDKLEVRTVEDIGYGLKRLGELGKLPGSQM